MLRSNLNSLILIALYASCANAYSALNWTQCALDATAAYHSNPNSTFLVGIDGVSTDNITKAWGISYNSCNKLCGPVGADDKFQWLTFLTGISSWILPWFALMAQLPYETEDTMSDISALILAMGSPLLVTYSLCVTILSSRWITKKLKSLRKQEQNRIDGQTKGRLMMMDGAWSFLNGSQHVPLVLNSFSFLYCHRMFNGGQLFKTKQRKPDATCK